jgi:hypothetical protein
MSVGKRDIMLGLKEIQYNNQHLHKSIIIIIIIIIIISGSAAQRGLWPPGS